MSSWSERPVWTLPCLERHLGSLAARGIRRVGDVDPDLFPEAHDAIQKAHDRAETAFETCADMYDAHRKTDVGLVTFNDGVDAVLGDDGLMPGKVTEIYGQAGSGKTQLCLQVFFSSKGITLVVDVLQFHEYPPYFFQLCANVQLPTVIGGLGGKALYLDTEGGFTAHRMKQIAVKTCRNAQKIFASTGCVKQSLVRRLSEDSMMAGVFYRRIRSAGELSDVLLLDETEDFLRKHVDVRLVVIDSLAFPFRYDLVDEMSTSQAHQSLQRIGQALFLAHHRLTYSAH